MGSLFYRKKRMKKYPLIGISIIAVVVLILASLNNVVGFQTIQSSNQNVISKEVNQKESLFQTIIDITNNKEIQRIILKSQISKGGFFNPDVRFSLLNTPCLTKNQLKHIYQIGLILTKIVSKSRMYSIVEEYRLINPGMQKEISAAIENNPTIKVEIMQLSNIQCDCGNNSEIIVWDFPILCLLLIPFLVIALWLAFHGGSTFLGDIIVVIASALNCSWLH